MEKTIVTAAMILLAVCMLAVLVRLIKGPKVTDRILAVNALTTLIIGEICLLSRLLQVDYLIDVALIYALLGFVVNTLLTRMLINSKKKEAGK